MASPSPGARAPAFISQLLTASDRLAKDVAAWRRQNAEALHRVINAVRGPLDGLNRRVAAHSEEIGAVLARLQEFQQLQEHVAQEWRQAGVGYLIAPLDLGEQLFLSVHAAPGEASALFDFLEDCLAHSDLIERVCTALDEASVLSDPSRHHLEHGLHHVQRGELTDAWPPLIIGLEGAFADVAVDQGYAARSGNHVYLVGEDGQPLSQKISSVEGVVKTLGHAPNESEFGEFLVKRVYGGEGNPFRHGTAQGGIRDRTICLTVAVIGWLDVFVTPGSRDLLRQSVRDELIRRHDAEPSSSERVADGGSVAP